MPIHQEGSGYQWGNHGKVYPTCEGAEKQASAAHANGFTGDCDINTLREIVMCLQKLVALKQTGDKTLGSFPSGYKF
jgi:hypothetical protein